MGMLAACSDDPEVARPRPNTSATETPQECGRAVLVYMLADNSLGADGYDRENLADMIAAARDGLLGDNRLIIYHDDRKADRPMMKEVTPYGLKILKEYDNGMNSTNPRRMEEAVADFKRLAPARNYGLIFWSHATGWPLGNMPMANSSAITPQWVGEDRGSHLDVNQLADVLRGEGFDYIYFDCCHLASVEALYELRDVADWFVGSAAELPAEGMPYYRTLPYLMADEADLVGAATQTFTKYDQLTGMARTSTMSVVKASELDALASATASLYALHPSLPADYAGQRFERPKSNGESCYLFDFEDYIKNLDFGGNNAAASLAVNQWEAALHRAVVYHASTPWIFNTIQVKAHCGLTTYILRSQSDAANKGYAELQWFRDVASSL